MGRTLGIDWSGSASAGKKIWAAQISFSSERAHLENLCRPFAKSMDAAGVAAAFANWLGQQSFDAAGLDFCFSVSREHIMDDLPQTGPKELGRWIIERDLTPSEFRQLLAPERKRATDRLRRSPFAPTNLRMFRQTYWGLRALAKVSLPILPWEQPGEQSIIEVLPAHVARTLCSDCKYEGRSPVNRCGRERLLQTLRDVCRLDMAAESAKVIVDDAEGDALDAVLAAIAAATAMASGYHCLDETGEGWIYSVDD